MRITFRKLQVNDFPILLKWLNQPHVKQWWDGDISWTKERVAQKYMPYTEGVKVLKGIKKPIYAFIIEVDTTAIGYIQYYNKRDFPPEQGYYIDDLPESLAGLDVYIGEPAALGKGLGVKILKQFLQEEVFIRFSQCSVDPDTANQKAITIYERAGFKNIKEIEDCGITWMLASGDKI